MYCQHTEYELDKYSTGFKCFFLFIEKKNYFLQKWKKWLKNIKATELWMNRESTTTLTKNHLTARCNNINRRQLELQ